MAISRHGNSLYRIVFRGESNVLAEAFPDLSLEFEDGNTVLTGPIPDRAQLQGLLAQADALGFELVSVNPIGDQRKESKHGNRH
jgi:hypothetical protein